MAARIDYHAAPTPACPTRDCTDPWFFAQLTATREVRPCCWHPPVGTLPPGGSLEGVLNGPEIRKLRAELLTGHLNEHCLVCPARSPTSMEALRARLERELAQSVIAVRRPDECPAHLPSGGHVDSIAVGPELVRLHGWGMLDVGRSCVFAGTDLAVKRASVQRSSRPDVAKATGDERLSNSGIVITLELASAPSKPWTLKIWTDDPRRGAHRVHIPADPTIFSPE
jgi:hypothetical protein